MPRAKKNREELTPVEVTEQNPFETEAVSKDTVETAEPIQTETATTEPATAPVEAEAPDEVSVIVPESEAEEATDAGDTTASEPAESASADAPETEEDGVSHLTLSLPVSMFEQSPGSMQRLKAAIGSKQTLLKKALGADSLEVVVEEDRVTFPWFTLTSEDNSAEVDAYSKLVFALSKKAITQTRVDPVEKVPDDLQLGMRLYLINLNFKGDEFKSARAVLMRNFKSTGGGTSAGSTKYEFTMPEVYKP